jgi:hypothetical protein
MKRIHFMRDYPPLQRNMPPEDIGHSRWPPLRMAILNILSPNASADWEPRPPADTAANFCFSAKRSPRL